ncbi:MAG TPA: hypothetical protein VFK70_20440, partial [Vicinamibacteria bacterium]|nr:hypothetical protein [Vicinamibacteria bacterium]
MRTTRWRAALGGSSLVMLWVALGLGGPAHGAPPRPQVVPARPSPSPSATARPADATWEEVGRLVTEQKYQAAADVVAQIRAGAQARGDEADWTRALVREAQIRGGLHAYETAVRLLREAPWPPSASNKAILELFYGQTLANYHHAYSWEIRQRERVESKDPLDLKKWTTDEVANEATRAYAHVWAQRDNLGVDPIDRFGDNLRHGNYPERVRGTARDLLSYLIVELLADSSLWSPDRQELYSLDVRTLLGPVHADVDDPAAHALTKLAAVLTDLEAWHTAGGRRESAFEARLERLRRLHVAFTSDDDRKLIRDDLERRLPAVRDVEWWSVGQAVLAGFVKEAPEPDALVRARAIAQAGAAAYPETVGGRQCRAIVEAIEAPSYQLTAMSLDGARRPSIDVSHANLERLWFRAYAVDLADRLRTARDYHILPQWQEVSKLVADGRAAAEWAVDLPATPDYRRHRTFVTPALDRPGLYLVVASARPEFRREEGTNQLQAVNLLISDLVLVRRPTGVGLEVAATSGRTGEPVAGASVELWQLDWQKGHHPLLTGTTST